MHEFCTHRAQCVAYHGLNAPLQGPKQITTGRRPVRWRSGKENGSSRATHDVDPHEDPVLYDQLYGAGASDLAGAVSDRRRGTATPLSPMEAAEALGMGTWRLRAKVDPVIEMLVSQVEGVWRTVLGDDLQACDQIPDRFLYLDSLNTDSSRQFSFLEPDPPKDDPAWPRFEAEIWAYAADAFRKLHLEVAVRQDGLQIAHCVMFPRITFDLPIVCFDVVSFEGKVSLAIIDACPVSKNLSLPGFYVQALTELQSKYGTAVNRNLPEWGKALFSPYCVCLRPETSSQLSSFIKYSIALTNFHMTIGRLARPVTEGGAASQRSDEILESHRRYRAKQLENDKTRKVLEKSFGRDVAQEYMEVVMFDIEE
jgi:phycocyanobilin:ferredoxin oxidoreductase